MTRSPGTIELDDIPEPGPPRPGRVVAIGLPVGTAPVRPGIFPEKEIDVFGSSYACLPDFSEAVRLVSQYRSAVGKLLTHRFPLARTADAFEFALKHEPGAVKILITVNAAESEM